jgi:predicted nucleic acid-binding protein
VKLVLDASVVLKWFFSDRPGEAGSAAALALLKAVGDGAVSLYQPPHFIAEVAAVLAREMPDQAQARLADEVYLRKASRQGRIVGLATFSWTV